MLRLDHVLRDCGLADLDAQLEELSVDSRRAPQWVDRRHLADQLTHFSRHSRPTWPAVAILPSPVEAEAFAVPADDRLGLDDEQGSTPVGPEAAEDIPERSVSPSKRRSATISLED